MSGHAAPIVGVNELAGQQARPVAVARLTHAYDTVTALGVVIRGGTARFDFVCQ